MSGGVRHSAALQLMTPESLQEEIALMFADVQARKPDTVLLMARAGNALVLRMAGSMEDVMHIYTHGGEEVMNVLRDSLSIATGDLNG